MTTFHKAFTAMAFVALIGLVGCAKPDAPTKTKTEAKTEAQKTEPAKAEEPKKVEPNPSGDNGKQPMGSEGEAGSGENKGGLDIPNGAEAGSTEK